MVAFVIFMVLVIVLIIGGVLINVYLYSHGAMRNFWRSHFGNAMVEHSVPSDNYSMSWGAVTNEDMGRSVRRMALGMLGVIFVVISVFSLLLFNLLR